MRPLPGQRSPSIKIASIIRVNHAGEYGAKRIYEGQLAVLKGTPVEPVLIHMKEQENKHLEAFEKWVIENRVRPTFFQPLWHMAGYALGVGTALLGEKAAMACTTAVEEVIDEHYTDQLHQLGSANPALTQLIQTCQAEEREHRDLAFKHGATEAIAYPLLSKAIKTASRCAIWISKRI